MQRTAVAAGVALATAALALGATTRASASPSGAAQPLALHEHIDFNTGLLRFTADAPLCPSGSWVDDVTDVRPPGGDPATATTYRITIDSVYTCDDGSGTFFGHKVITLHIFPNGSSQSTGPITISGGTGRYSGISAVGSDSGAVGADQLGTGTIHGAVRGL